MKKKAFYVVLLVLLVLLNVVLFRHQGSTTDNVELHVMISGSVKAELNDYYSKTKAVDGQNTSTVDLKKKNKEQEAVFPQSSDTRYTRLDFGVEKATFTISRMWYEYKGQKQNIDISAYTKENATQVHDIYSSKMVDGKLVVHAKKNDPYIQAKVGPTKLAPAITAQKVRSNMIRNIVMMVVVDLLAALLFRFRHKFSGLPQELWGNRKLIMNLAKNDFKTRYAGSVLGITWAFVQPLVTILVYWFVFEVALGSGPQPSQRGVAYPFVLWLISGLVPWFFFQDTLTSGTNALIEYSYLVKKVVFKISILPLVKEISAFFVHIFFILLLFILFFASGPKYWPDIHAIQVIYYTFAMSVYALGCCFLTSSIVVFFRDLSQIISIIIQVQVWITPIMWNIESYRSRIPGWAMPILQANPMYYIVMGYRDSMMNRIWFWQRFGQTIYFWIATAIMFAIGTFFFKRLKVHFADIL